MGPPSIEGTQDYHPESPEGKSSANSPLPVTVDASGKTGETVPATSEKGRAFPRVPGYLVEQELGRGGMGVVYLAQHSALKRSVALKLIRSGADADADQLHRFRVEAEAVAHLQHPNIVQIYEVGEHDGCPFCALEFLPGGNLASRLQGRPLPPEEAAATLETLARAVHHAHQKGIVHRDLKPANILLAADGAPKITDFGLAKRFEEDDGSLTRTGAVMGTPAYMAPEQAAGLIREIGPATDIFALGVILYQMLTGKLPFQGESTIATLQLLQTADPLPPTRLNAGIPRDLETICLKCLEKERDRRYSSALALAQDLERFRSDEPILARREGVTRKIWRFVRRRALVVGLSTAVLLAVAVAAVIVLQASTTRQAAVLAREIDKQIDLDEWPAGQADRLVATIEQLEQLDAKQAESARHRLNDRMTRRIRDAIARPRVTAENVPGIEQDLAWLTRHDAATATDLSAQLRKRLRAWQPLVDLMAPYTSVGDVFAPAQIRVDAAGLQPAAGAPTILPTRQKSQGNVRVTAEFAEGWESSREIAVMVHHVAGSPLSGYQFILAAKAPRSADTEAESTKAKAPIDFHQSHRHAELRITRNGVVMQRHEFVLPAGPLRIMGERDATLLRTQVNDFEAITSNDPMPISGGEKNIVAVSWPGKTTLLRFRIDSSVLPPLASPLERADQAFDDGQVTDALNLYHEQGRRASDIQAEARCKAGLCLLALNRPDEAAGEFTAVMKMQGEQWPIVAAAQLWLIHLRAKRYTEANDLFALISVRYTSEQLAHYVPIATREEIGRAEKFPLMNHLSPDPKLVERMESLVRIAELLRLEESQYYSGNFVIALALNREYIRASAQADRNLKADMAQLLRQGGGPSEGLYWSLRWLCWTARALGDAKLAVGSTERLISEWDTRTASVPGQSTLFKRGAALLRLEQVRNLAAVGKWDDAEAEIDRFHIDCPAPIGNYTFFSQPYLLKGFLLSRRGDEAGAQAAWKKGVFSAYLEQLPPEDRSTDRIPKGSWGLLDFWMMTSLTDTLPEDTAILLSNALISKLSSDPTMAQVGRTFQVSPSVLRNAWRSPRARDIARRIAFLEMEPVEFGRLPPVVLIYEKFRQDLFAGTPSKEEDDLSWEVAHGCADTLFAGKLSKSQVVQLALAWKGNAGLFGWSGVESSLPATIRPATASLMGVRYVRLGRPKDAAAMFRRALKEAPAVSAPALIARQQLNRIEQSPPQK